MISANTIRERMSWAEITEAEAAARLGAAIARELSEIPEDDPQRRAKAISRAARDLWVTAYQSGCMACLGADVFMDVLPETGEAIR